MASIFQVPGLLYAQDIPSSSSGKLTFYLDHSCYAGTDEKTRVEFYLMFYSDQLTKISDSLMHQSQINISAVVKDLKGEIVNTSNWTTEVNFNDSEENSLGKVIYDKWSEELLPGTYEISVEAKDLLGDSEGKIRRSSMIPRIEKGKWSISQLEFISSIEAKKDEDHFVKGNFQVIPNPSRRYGILIPKLYFYYEVYGIDTSKGELTVDYVITDKDNISRKELSEIKIQKPSISASVIHGIDVSNLSTGIYDLNVLVMDSENYKTLSLKRQFEIIQADFFLNTETISEEQSEIFKTILTYLGTPQQLNFYTTLDFPAKTKYILQYWKNLDHDPTTDENEYLSEIQKRFNHSKKYFGWAGTNGWDSDRGRICIKYGIPHQVNQFNNEANTAPYEIWTYNEDRTYQFIFGDLRSDGRFILLHSNKEGEIYNQNWLEQIQKM